MHDRRQRAGGLAAGALLVLAAAASAQKSKPPEAPPAVDPYTRGEPEALARAGYRSFGPLRFGPSNSQTIQSHLGDVPILWVETEHFCLGSSLEEYRPAKSAEADELERELAELAKVLERI